MATRLKDASEVSVFSFPDASGTAPEKKKALSGEQSWANLADAMKVLATPDRPMVEPVYRRATLDQLEKPKAVPVQVETESEAEEELAAEEPIEGSEQAPEEKDPAGVQKVLDETFNRGLKQGRQEGRDALLQELRDQAVEQGFAEGEQSGREQGFTQGLQQSEAEVAQRVEALASLYKEMQAQRRILDQTQVQQAAVLLEKLMLEILRVELKHSPEQIENLVAEAVQLLDTTEHETLKVRIHPSDAQWLQPILDSEQYPVRLLEDAKMTPGGCRIEGSLGDVDATLETRLKDGVNHLRTLLLDDPQQVPEADLSGADLSEVTDELRRHRSEPAKQRQPEVKVPGNLAPEPSLSFNSVADRQTESQAVEPEESAASSFSFNPGAESNAALGAWDALGQ